MKQTAVEWLVNEMREYDWWYLPESMKEDIIDQAKAMEKEQIKDSFVECWKSNVPDGIECKLDAEQYYNETFKQ